MTFDILLSKLQQAFQWVMNLDWKDPKVILSAVAVVILPFIAKYLVLTAIVIALCLGISMLFVVEKLPQPLKNWIHAHPLLADLSIGFIAVLSISTFFTSGLTLALGMIFLDVLLALTLPYATAPRMLPQLG